MLEVNVRKQLRDFTLDMAFSMPGESCMALIGPTGCGKSMTLRMIAGLQHPDAGRITSNGTALFDSEQRVDMPPFSRRVGFVFQDYALFPHLSVLANVMYGPEALGSSAQAARDAAMTALERVQMARLVDERPRRLSGGQQQRVALARALATDPQILLLDEPISALDTQVRNQVRSELRSFIRSVGICTIIVTHDHVDALTLGDDICVMQEGRVIQKGTRQELLTRPADEFVADFLGLNLFRGEARKTPDGVVEVQCEAGRFFTTEQLSGPVFLTCHPHDVTVSLERPAGSALNEVHGRVSSLVHLGGTVRVTVDNGGTIVAEVSARSAEEMGLEVGAEVYANFKASAARCYA